MTHGFTSTLRAHDKHIQARSVESISPEFSSLLKSDISAALPQPQIVTRKKSAVHFHSHLFTSCDTQPVSLFKACQLCLSYSITLKIFE